MCFCLVDLFHVVNIGICFYETLSLLYQCTKLNQSIMYCQ